jgi:hypothetical protein
LNQRKNNRSGFAKAIQNIMIQKINLSSILFFILFYVSTVQMLTSRSLPYKENCFFESLDNSPVDTTQDLRQSEITNSVKCVLKPDQSYALYIPMHYVPEKRWPIIYIFDPAARGNIPIELMKEAAEHFGYILAASNNSRNGPWEPEAKAAQAMWEDTHARLAINDSAIYFAGFSGGARVAAYLAQDCKCAQGVLLNGAGFSTSSSPSSEDRFAVFSIVGFTDMNYDELVRLNKTLDKLGYMHFLRRFNGSHQWGPKGVWQEAFAWMWLIAMKNGRQPRDEQFITAELIATLQRAKMLEDSGDVFFAWQNDRNASDIFQGLTDTKKIDDHTADMKKNEAVREGQEREEKELDEQIRIQSKVLNIIALIQKPKPKWLTNEQLNNYNVGDLSFSDLRTQAQEAIRRLRNNLEDENRLERRRFLERVCGVIFSSLMETAQSDIDSNNLQIAKNFLELAIELQPMMYRPHIYLARCLIRMEDKEESIHELGQARKLGLSAQALSGMSKQISELSSLVDDPEFQKFITDMPDGY